MLNAVLLKNNKDVNTGEIIIESINPATKTPLQFRKSGDNCIIIQPNQLIAFLESLKSQQAEINKLCRSFADGKTFKIEIADFGVKGSTEVTEPKDPKDTNSKPDDSKKDDNPSF